MQLGSKPRIGCSLVRMKLFSWIKSIINRALISLVAKYNSRNGVFAVEIRSTVGLGARLEWCLEILAYSVENGKSPIFIKISSITELSLGKDYDRVLNIDLASFLINKYLVVKDDVLSEVEDFCSKHFANRRVLGVHYRGKDKVKES